MGGGPFCEKAFVFRISEDAQLRCEKNARPFWQPFTEADRRWNVLSSTRWRSKYGYPAWFRSGSMLRLRRFGIVLGEADPPRLGSATL